MEQPSEPQTKRRPRFKQVLLIVVAIILIVGGAGGWKYEHRNSGPVPKAILKSTNFAIYYPSSLPSGYTLNKNSFSQQNGVLFFQINANDKTISISEQQLPKIPPDFDTIQKFNTSFKQFDLTAGKSLLGIDAQSNNPIAIVITNTTLININASNEVPRDVVAKIIENLASLPN